jgi:hypothetical protein
LRELGRTQRAAGPRRRLFERAVIAPREGLHRGHERRLFDLSRFTEVRRRLVARWDVALTRGARQSRPSPSRLARARRRGPLPVTGMHRRDGRLARHLVKASWQWELATIAPPGAQAGAGSRRRHSSTAQQAKPQPQHRSAGSSASTVRGGGRKDAGDRLSPRARRRGRGARGAAGATRREPGATRLMVPGRHERASCTPCTPRLVPVLPPCRRRCGGLWPVLWPLILNHLFSVFPWHFL